MEEAWKVWYDYEMNNEKIMKIMWKMNEMGMKWIMNMKQWDTNLDMRAWIEWEQQQNDLEILWRIYSSQWKVCQRDEKKIQKTREEKQTNRLWEEKPSWGRPVCLCQQGKREKPDRPMRQLLVSLWEEKYVMWKPYYEDRWGKQQRQTWPETWMKWRREVQSEENFCSMWRRKRKMRKPMEWQCELKRQCLKMGKIWKA